MKDIDFERMKFYCAWDLAIGQRDRNDYSVGMVMGVDEYEQLHVVDVVRGRFDGYELVEKILENFSEEEQVVYDPFMGTGTTAIVAMKMNRYYIGSEISSEYCALTKSKLSDIERRIKC